MHSALSMNKELGCLCGKAGTSHLCDGSAHLSGCVVNGYGCRLSYYYCLFSEEACLVTPREGTALIFNHDTLHEGLPVTAGVKYILRTDLMFHRVDREMIPDPMSYQTNEDYLSTLALYQKSWELEQGVTACSVSVVLVVAYPRIRQP